jgi:hypothetical protein
MTRIRLTVSVFLRCKIINYVSLHQRKENNQKMGITKHYQSIGRSWITERLFILSGKT